MSEFPMQVGQVMDATQMDCPVARLIVQYASLKSEIEAVFNDHPLYEGCDDNDYNEIISGMINIDPRSFTVWFSKTEKKKYNGMNGEHTVRHFLFQVDPLLLTHDKEGLEILETQDATLSQINYSQGEGVKREPTLANVLYAIQSDVNYFDDYGWEKATPKSLSMEDKSIEEIQEVMAEVRKNQKILNAFAFLAKDFKERVMRLFEKTCHMRQADRDLFDTTAIKTLVALADGNGWFVEEM